MVDKTPPVNEHPQDPGDPNQGIISGHEGVHFAENSTTSLLEAAEIRHFNAEAKKWEMEIYWKSGWRAYIKSVIGGLAAVALVWFYFNIYFDAKIKYSDFIVTKSEKALEELKKGEDEARKEYRNLWERSQLIKGQYDESVRKHNAQSQYLQDRASKLEEERKKNLAELEAVRQKLQALLEKEKMLQNDFPDFVSLLNSARAELEEVNQQQGEGFFVEGIPEFDSVEELSRKDIEKERIQELQIIFEDFQKSGVDDFETTGPLAQDWLVAQSKKVKVPPEETILAGVRKVFGERIIFSSQAIYSKEAFQRPRRIEYKDLTGAEISAQKYFSVEIQGLGNLDVAGSSLKKSELKELIENLQKLVSLRPKLFSPDTSNAN